MQFTGTSLIGRVNVWEIMTGGYSVTKVLCSQFYDVLYVTVRFYRTKLHVLSLSKIGRGSSSTVSLNQ